MSAESRALSDRSDKSDKSDKALSGALESWLGPLADELAKITGDDVSGEAFGDRLRACAEGKKFGSSERFEQLSGKDMENQYADSHKSQ